MKQFAGLCMAGILCFGIITPVKAEESSIPSAEEVFPIEEVQKLREKVKDLPVYNDKGCGEITSNSVTRSTGTYPTRAGVILVTDDYFKNIIPTGHAAIVYSSDKVVESLQDGVIYGKNDWHTSKMTCTAVAVSGTTVQEESFAAAWCSWQLNKKYNYNYADVNTREKFYCSQLVWAAYKDCYGIDLNTPIFGAAIHPGELVDSERTYVIYKK